MNMQSSLYKELTRDQVASIMEAVFPGETVSSYTLLSGGLFNTTYRVVTSRHDVVLRMGPVHRELLLPYEHHLMAAESLTDRLCLEHGIPASNVLHLDISKAVIDRDFMVVDRIDALPLSAPSIPEDRKPDLLRECGHLTRKLHSVTGTQFGRLANIVAGKGSSSWYEAVKEEFDEVFESAAKYCLFNGSLRDKSYRFLAQRKEHLDAITEPRLAHCDLWAGNVLIETAGGNYRVCAIIDGDRAMFGDPALDFAAGWMTTPEFLEGYGITTDTSSADSSRRAVYSLFFRLQDAYIWKIEYNRDDFFEEALRTAEKILET